MLRGECSCVGAQAGAPRLALTFSDPPPRIVCEMEESLVPSPPPGPVELCVGDCSTDFRTQSEQLYSFVVCKPPAPSHTHSFWEGVALPALGCFLLPSGILLSQTPTFNRVSPSRGPASGGTRLTISGSSLDAGSKITVTVRDGECQFVRCVGPFQSWAGIGSRAERVEQG